jgi:hypothetical protein
MRRMTETERVVAMLILFPPLWMFLPVIATCAAIGALIEATFRAHARIRDKRHAHD